MAQNPNISHLDAHQIANRAFDPLNDRIRVDAEINATIDNVDVIISQENDSIRIGDGADLVTATIVGSDVGLDVNVIGGSVTLQQPQTPTIYNVTVTTANTEFFQTLSNNTKSFLVRVRGTSKLKLAFNSGDSGTNYITVPAGSVYSMDNIDFTGTLYFQTTQSSQIVEILEWV